MGGRLWQFVILIFIGVLVALGLVAFLNTRYRPSVREQTGAVQPEAPAPVPAPIGPRSVPELTPAVSQPAAVVGLIAAAPIEGLTVRDLHDSFDEIHGGHKHEAIDIMEARGTPIRAVVDGSIKKLFVSKAGGNTIYQFDVDEKYCYYYAHLDRYADGIHENMQLHRGDLIGYVGFTGDADPNAPHLHFTIFELGPEKKWWQGAAINPYPFLVQAVQAQAR